MSNLDELFRAVDARTALRICARWGGQTLYVPDKAKPDHPIARAIGHDAMERICSVFGSQTVDLPMLTNLFERERQARNVQLLVNKGLSAKAIAKILEMSRATVDEIIREDPDLSLNSRKMTGDPEGEG